MTPSSLPLVSPDQIPAAMLPYLVTFQFPSGAKIQRMSASDYDLEGWVIEPRGIAGEWMYADGSIDSRPRYRAFADLGFVNGDDDLKTDADWSAVATKQEEYSRLLLMDLPTAWNLAQEHGLANREAVTGEKVQLRDSGEQAIVIDPGTQHDRGQYVRVQLDSEPDPQQTAVVPLKDLLFIS